jgi:hypothetical protein
MFIYGSILMDVTFKPVVFNNKPVEDAKTIKSIERGVLESWIALSRTNDSLPNAADYTSGYENVLGHGGTRRIQCTIEIRVAKISTGQTCMTGSTATATFSIHRGRKRSKKVFIFRS